jgi:hypothetical protein
MDALCTPTIATAALFVALLFLDLFRHDFELLPGHAFAGVLSTGLMAVLCQYGAGIAAWGLLLLPFIIVIFGWAFWAAGSVPIKPYPSHINPAAAAYSKHT